MHAVTSYIRTPSIYIPITLVVTYILYKLTKKPKSTIPGIPLIPLIPSPKSSDFRTALHDAAEKYPNQPYVAPFQDPTVIIPGHCIEELKNLPDSILSTNGSMYDRFAIRWTNSGWVDKELAHSIKYDLANEVDSFFGTIQDEIAYAVNTSLPQTRSWTARAPQPALANIVGLVLGRMIVGGPVNRDKTWLASSVDHAMAVVVYSMWLRQVPTSLRSVFAHILPQKKAVDKSKKGIADVITPIMERQMRVGTKEEGEEGRLTKWLLGRYRPKENASFDPKLVLRDHYSLCFAAIHGPTFLLVQALIDLASYPAYAKRLQDEVDAQLASVSFHQWTRKTVASMRFLDAFCKESARTNPQGLIGWLRKTHKPVTLSTGHTIPADTLVAALNPLYNASATPHIEDGDKFNPERWLRDSDDENQDAYWKFGSATTDSLIFGYGKHACPGRPFGVTMVKDILALIISKWDVRLAGGVRERPQNICMDFIVMPPIAPVGNLEIELKLR